MVNLDVGYRMMVLSCFLRKLKAFKGGLWRPSLAGIIYIAAISFNDGILLHIESILS